MPLLFSCEQHTFCFKKKSLRKFSNREQPNIPIGIRPNRRHVIFLRNCILTISHFLAISIDIINLISPLFLDSEVGASISFVSPPLPLFPHPVTQWVVPRRERVVQSQRLQGKVACSQASAERALLKIPGGFASLIFFPCR